MCCCRTTRLGWRLRALQSVTVDLRALASGAFNATLIVSRSIPFIFVLEASAEVRLAKLQIFLAFASLRSSLTSLQLPLAFSRSSTSVELRINVLCRLPGRCTRLSSGLPRVEQMSSAASCSQAAPKRKLPVARRAVNWPVGGARFLRLDYGGGVF